MAAAAVAGNVDDSCGGKDGPVLSMMNKRLRALKKKLNRILQLEEAKEKGKAINKEQEDVLKSKLQVCALIEEYDRLRQPLLAAVREEIAEKEKEWLAAKEEQVFSEDKDGVSNESLEARTESGEVSNGISENVGVGEAEDAAVATAGAAASIESVEKSEVLADSSTSSVAGFDETLMDMIQLLYFALLFDVRPHDAQSFMRKIKFHERVSCLSYDLVTDDSTAHLTEADLDALAAFASLITSRPPNATLSHRDALQTCVAHARNWLQNSEAPIDSEILNLTYAELREKLNMILATEYFTMRPELQTVTSEIPPAHYGGEQAVSQEHYVNGDTGQTSAGNVSDSSGTNAEISQQPDETPKPDESQPAQEQERQADENRGIRPRQNYVQKFRTNRGVGGNVGNANYGRGRGRRGRGGVGGGGNAGGNVGYSSNGNHGNRGGQYYDQTGYYPRGSYYGNRRGRGYYSNNAVNANQVNGELAST